MASELVNECIPVEQDANSIWESLSTEVVEEIFARLPADCVLRLRRVCKGWNNLFSSKNFLTLWSLTPKSHQWLILCTTSYCAAYSFPTKKWLAIPLSALPECFPGCSYKGSEVGLILLQKYSSLGWTFCIFNPLTQTDFQLDPPTSLNLKNIDTTYIVKGDHVCDYKVVVVSCNQMGAQVMQIYDSYEKSWKIAGQISHSKVGNEMALRKKIAFCNSLFFVMVINTSLGNGIRVCSIQDCTVSTFIPTPAIDEFSMSKLIVCGKLILLVVPKLKVTRIKDIIVLQLESQENFKDPSWKEIARMPQFILDRFDDRFNREASWNRSDCIGLDNCLCFRIFGGTDVVEFNLIERSWEFLSKCPTADRSEILCCVSF